MLLVPYFTGKETEAQAGQAINQKVAKLGFEH